MTKGITVNDNFIPCDPSKVSDGYHTFEELYDHRCLLFIQLIGLLPDKSFASYCHSDETVWEGWFIAGCKLNSGMITYHLPIKFADLIPNSVWVPKAPEWDGHTSRDVCDRLIKEAKEAPLFCIRKFKKSSKFTKKISKEESEIRKPLSPEILISALQDPIHKN